MGDKVSIIEVGPRDGLQNEKANLGVEERVSFIERLAAAGVRRIEVGSFVSPKWVPQMVNSGKVLESVLQKQRAGIIPNTTEFLMLVPNAKGMTDAIQSGCREVAVFAAASETFSKKNTNCTIQESFERIEEVVASANRNQIRFRGYISTAFYCPYEGRISTQQVLRVAEHLLTLGCFEISVGDTIGAATPREIQEMLKALTSITSISKLAMHFHDTRGTALANTLASLEFGVRSFDSSLGGLGGCPYAPGAAGNVATEDLIYMLEGMGLKTEIDLAGLLDINKWMAKQVGHDLPSRLAKAGLPKK